MRILYPKADVAEWKARYKLETDNKPCVKCGKFFPYVIPFASNNFRGISQEDHDCGKEYTHHLLTPIGKEAEEWKEIVNALKEEG